MASFSEFLTPRNISVQNVSDTRSKITLSPLERGFGHTLGNALRRILLSSMQGAAIVDVEIRGVEHEYSSIEGVQEDVIEILLNLKGVALKMHSGNQTELNLLKQGPGVVKAVDIDVSHDIEIANPDHVIAHINSNTNCFSN